MTGPGAPRVFYTHRGGARWAAEHNPYPAGTKEHFEWLRDFWRDQADRGFARSERTAKIAIAFAVFAVLVNVLNLVLRLTGVLP